MPCPAIGEATGARNRTERYWRMYRARPAPLLACWGLPLSSHSLPIGRFWEDLRLQISVKYLLLLVPGAGFEPATNGLQNRCSTTELTRRLKETSITYAVLRKARKANRTANCHPIATPNGSTWRRSLLLPCCRLF